MYQLCLTPIDVAVYPITTVVRDDPNGWTIFAGDEAVPTKEAPCIVRGFNRSTQLSAFITKEQHQRTLTVRPGRHADPAVDGSFADDAPAEIRDALELAIGKASAGLAWKTSYVWYKPLAAFEMTVQLFNGNVRKPRGHCRVNFTNIKPPPGWAFVPLDGRKINSAMTVHQGEKWTWRMLVCPIEWQEAATKWAREAGRAVPVDAHGRVVTPRPSGFAWPLHSPALRTYLVSNVSKWFAQYEAGQVTTGWAPYGQDAEGSDGESDPGGQKYGGPTGGQKYEDFTDEVAACVENGVQLVPVFRLLNYLSSSEEDRDLFITDDSNALDVELMPVGFKFSLSPANGADLYGSNSGDVFGFNGKPNEPDTVNRQHGPFDRQHGLYRTNAAKLNAALFNDVPSKEHVVIDAGVARAETPGPALLKRGGAINRADGHSLTVMSLACAFDVHGAYRDAWLNNYSTLVRTIQRGNGGLGDWTSGKEVIWYAMDFRLSQLGLTAKADQWKIDERARTGKDPTEAAWLAWCASQGVKFSSAVRPEQDGINLFGMWSKMQATGSFEDIVAMFQVIAWITGPCRGTNDDGTRLPGPYVRVDRDGNQLDHGIEAHYYRMTLAIAAHLAILFPVARTYVWQCILEHTGAKDKAGVIAFFNTKDNSRYVNAGPLIALLQQIP